MARCVPPLLRWVWAAPEPQFWATGCRGPSYRLAWPSPEREPHPVTLCEKTIPAGFASDRACPGSVHQRGGRFKELKNMYGLSRPGPREPPKSAGNGGPGPPRYPRTVLGKHWISKSGWGAGWAPSGCPGPNVYSQYKMLRKGPQNPSKST